MPISSGKQKAAKKVASVGETNVGDNWYCQIGPNVSAPCSGSILGSTAFFVVSPFGDATQTYAHASNDGGQTWLPIPNNQGWSIQGSNLQWQLNPLGTAVKFLIGPNG